MKFSDIPGHESAKKRLRQMADNNRLPHALLIEGPSGIGKMALARAFAQYVHCTNRTADGEPCGECQACRLHQSMNHIDVQWVYPVVKPEGSSTPPVSEDFRQQWNEYIDGRIYMDLPLWSAGFGKKNAQPITYVTESASLLHRLAFTSHVSQPKIVVWWLPERMNEEAANKLLKMIEEPPADTLFIMVSDSPRDILPTIYSRVQRIELQRLDDETIAAYLESCFDISHADALAAAHIADGSATRALQIVSGGDQSGQRNFDMFVQLMRLAWKRDVAALRNWADELAGMGREAETIFYDTAMRLLRENFVYNFNVPQINYMTTNEQQFATRFARFITVDNVERLIATMQRARTDIAANANGKIVNFDVAIKTIMLLIPPKQ